MSRINCYLYFQYKDRWISYLDRVIDFEEQIDEEEYFKSIHEMTSWADRQDGTMGYIIAHLSNGDFEIKPIEGKWQLFNLNEDPPF